MNTEAECNAGDMIMQEIQLASKWFTKSTASIHLGGW